MCVAFVWGGGVVVEVSSSRIVFFWGGGLGRLRVWSFAMRAVEFRACLGVKSR